MRLGDLAASLNIGAGDAAIEITGITADSRAVRPGFLFAALKGSGTDGAAFAGAAARAGAAAILASPDSAIEVKGLPILRTPDPRHALALLAAAFYPRQPEHLVAVTGTSGKTSVTVFARQIFAAAGYRAASIGTIGVVTGNAARYGTLTTPDPVDLHRTLDELAGEGVSHAALEASSHGLDQRRLDGLRLEAAGFTNLGRDHLDYHATVDDYLAAKLRLFRELLPAGRTAVIDGDSAEGVTVLGAARAAGHPVLTVGRRGRDIRLTDLAPDGAGQRLGLEVMGKDYDILLPLAGSFQASNALLAAGLAIAAGIAVDAAIAALAGLEGAPGRLERVAETPNGAAIFIDYAHKPDALRAVLAALRPMTRGRLVVVFGAGGDRDAGKRPLMGEAAAQGADIVVVTDDNPRSEDPAAIRAAILAGAPQAVEIAGREAAIRAAIAMLQPGDVLCIAGKGHETGQIVGRETLPFSDHAVVAATLAEAA